MIYDYPAGTILIAVRPIGFEAMLYPKVIFDHRCDCDSDCEIFYDVQGFNHELSHYRPAFTPKMETVKTCLP